MPLRAVVLFNIGPAFGGFRIAVRPGSFGLSHPVAFQELERALEGAQLLLVPHPPEAWANLGEAAFRNIVPRLEGQEGVVDLTGDAASDGDGDVVLRAWLPFRGWPLGGWVVYEGWHRTGAGAWTRFTEEELQHIW